MIKYKIIGHGSTHLFMLHGWFGDQTSFDALTFHLDLTQFKIVIPEYRGYGESRGMTGEYSIEEIAKDVLILAESLNLKTFNLLGHSMGGMVMQKILQISPLSVLSMIGVTPVPASGLSLDADTRALFNSAAKDDGVRSGIISHSVSERLGPAWATAMATKSRHSSDEAAFEAYGHAFIDTNFADKISGATLFVTVLAGEFDPELNTELLQHAYGTCFNNLTVKTINGAGHYPMDETPLYLAALINAHFETVES